MNPAFSEQANNNQNFAQFLGGLSSLSPTALNFVDTITKKLSGILGESDTLHAMNDALISQGRTSSLASRKVGAPTVAPKAVEIAPPSTITKLSM